MRNNALFLLSVLVLLVGFFSSTTLLTGAFSREVHTGVQNYGSIEQLRPYNSRGPLTLTSSLNGMLATASQSRIMLIFQKNRDFFLANVEEEIDLDFCRDLELQLGRQYENRNARVARFRQPELEAFEQYDLTGDEHLDITDQRLCRIIVQGQNQDSQQEKDVATRDCFEEGVSTCQNGILMICTRDARDILSYAPVPKPSHYARCLPGKIINEGNQGHTTRREPAYYTNPRVSTFLPA